MRGKKQLNKQEIFTAYPELMRGAGKQHLQHLAESKISLQK